MDQPKCEDLIECLSVTLEQLYHGAIRTHKYKRKVLCYGCIGQGFQSDACPTCQGSGTVNFISYGHPSVITQCCDQCKGTGRIRNTNRCRVCLGHKTLQQTSEVRVEVRRGMGENFRFRYESMGNQRPDYQPGDLIVQLRQIKHKVFRRVGNDLTMELLVSQDEAKYGFRKYVCNLAGKRLAVGLKPGNLRREFSTSLCCRLFNRGMPDYYNNSRKGVLIVNFKLDPQDSEVEMIDLE